MATINDNAYELSTPVKDMKCKFETDRLNTDKPINPDATPPKKISRNVLAKYQADLLSHESDKVRSKNSRRPPEQATVDVRATLNSLEDKICKEGDSHKAWKELKHQEKQQEEALLCTMYRHLPQEERNTELEHYKKLKNLEKQVEAERKYSDKVVAEMEYKNAQTGSTRKIKFTNVQSGIAEQYTSLSHTLQLKTPEQLEAEEQARLLDQAQSETDSGESDESDICSLYSGYTSSVGLLEELDY